MAKNNLIKEAHLAYQGGGSDKVYHIFLVKEKNDYVVNYQNGRRGGTMAGGTKTTVPVSLKEAERIFQKVYDEKFKKGYRPIEGDSSAPMIAPANGKEQTGIAPQLLNLIDDEELAKVLRDSTHWMQEKKDGVRLMIEWTPERVRGINRSGEEVALLPEVVDEIRHLIQVANRVDTTLLDGELVGTTYHVFDLLENNGGDMRSLSFGARFLDLSMLMEYAPNLSHIQLSPCYRTPKEKQTHFAQLKSSGAEGAVFKRADSLYVPGRPNSGGDQLKYKFWASGDFVVTRVNQKRSVAVHAFDAQGNDVALGNVTVPRNYVMPKEGDVVQVRYLYAYREGCLYQPQFKGVRDDKKAAECAITQLKYKGEGAEEPE